MNLDRIIELCRAARAAGTPGPMSTGEALTVALVLNRHDWLIDEGYTIAQALDRIDADSIPLLRDAERAMQSEGHCAESDVQQYLIACRNWGKANA